MQQNQSMQQEIPIILLNPTTRRIQQVANIPQVFTTNLEPTITLQEQTALQVSELEAVVPIATNPINPTAIDLEPVVLIATNPINPTAIDLGLVALTATSPINPTTTDLEAVALIATNPVVQEATTVTSLLQEVVLGGMVLEEDDKSIF